GFDLPAQPVQGAWYHVGLTYDGTGSAAGSMKVYWTKVDSLVTQAALLGSGSMAGQTLLGDPYTTIDLGIGNTPRSGTTGGSGRTLNFVGLIDEVRISDIARGPNDFIFVTATTPHAGDFDSDGDVDGADFVAWQSNFPKASGATRADGDADGDGDVDGADFVV